MLVPEVIHKRDHCTYTACYCEENVWKLCSVVQDFCPASEYFKCFCVFISNDSRKIPLWHQKISLSSERPVIWDYHVIFLYRDCKGTLVYDLDTELGFPCTLKEYAAACIGDEKILREEYRRMFRVIPACEFLETFASDRSHMLNDRNEWMSPPPGYPPIKCQSSSNNIQEFISMDKRTWHGEVFNLHEFLHKFQVHPFTL
uniref:Protein N-terminal glutamine amidohydrolase n=1 Tax=Arion vulgaris TaxID=1028688 RepID=A0A0B6Y895_9EUPU